MTTIERIAALEAERQQLLASGDDWTFADERRRGRLRDIKAELESLWSQERSIRAKLRANRSR